MSNRRTIQCWESQFDASFLAGKNYNFQIAKSVLSGTGTATFNVVWKSAQIAPRTTISWDTIYGLNWTVDIPAPGVSVSIAGDWLQCAEGEVYDLSPYGYWVASSATPEAGYMKVGNIEYSYPGGNGIHILIGVQNASGGFDVIYFDEAALFVGESGTYQPEETVMWWYEADVLTGTVLSTDVGYAGGADLTNPVPSTGLYEWYTTYLTLSGIWVNSATPPPSSLYAPPVYTPSGNSVPASNHYVSSVEIQLYPVAVTVVLSVAVPVTKAGEVIKDISGQLTPNLKAEIKFVNDITMIVTYNTPSSAAPGSLEAIGVRAGSNIDSIFTDPIAKGLEFGLVNGNLPKGETWIFT